MKYVIPSLCLIALVGIGPRSGQCAERLEEVAGLMERQSAHFLYSAEPTYLAAWDNSGRPSVLDGQASYFETLDKLRQDLRGRANPTDLASSCEGLDESSSAAIPAVVEELLDHEQSAEYAAYLREIMIEGGDKLSAWLLRGIGDAISEYLWLDSSVNDAEFLDFFQDVPDGIMSARHHYRTGLMALRSFGDIDAAIARFGLARQMGGHSLSGREARSLDYLAEMLAIVESVGDGSVSSDGVADVFADLTASNIAPSLDSLSLNMPVLGWYLLRLVQHNALQEGFPVGELLAHIGDEATFGINSARALALGEVMAEEGVGGIAAVLIPDLSTPLVSEYRAIQDSIRVYRRGEREQATDILRGMFEGGPQSQGFAPCEAAIRLSYLLIEAGETEAASATLEEAASVCEAVGARGYVAEARHRLKQLAHRRVYTEVFGLMDNPTQFEETQPLLELAINLTESWLDSSIGLPKEHCSARMELLGLLFERNTFIGSDEVWNELVDDLFVLVDSGECDPHTASIAMLMAVEILHKTNRPEETIALSGELAERYPAEHRSIGTASVYELYSRMRLSQPDEERLIPMARIIEALPRNADFFPTFNYHVLAMGYIGRFTANRTGDESVMADMKELSRLLYSEEDLTWKYMWE